MAAAVAAATWPCPACAGLLPAALGDCPHCQFPAAWVDLMLALGYAARQFHYWSIVGELTRPQFQAIVATTRQRQEQMLAAGQRGQPVPAQTGLPDADLCWRCQRPAGTRLCPSCGALQASPAVRLLRYKSFLSQEVKGHAQAGRLTPQQAERFQAELAGVLADLRVNLAKE